MTTRQLTVLTAALVTGACASAPKIPPTVEITRDQKMAWILQLDDHRMLRETLPAPPPDPKQKKGTPAPTPQVRQREGPRPTALEDYLRERSGRKEA